MKSKFTNASSCVVLNFLQLNITSRDTRTCAPEAFSNVDSIRAHVILKGCEKLDSEPG
jgi:hypothetical protein